MRFSHMLKGIAFGAAALGLMSMSAHAADKVIKIGVIYDYSGPLAGGGSELQALGAKTIIDHIN